MSIYHSISPPHLDLNLLPSQVFGSPLLHPLSHHFSTPPPAPSRPNQPHTMSNNRARYVQEKFDDGVEPLAQLIMLDAAHGDSNIIDFCTKYLEDPLDVPATWQRFLIDTGPSTNEIGANLERVIGTYKQPISPGGYKPPEPKLYMVQLTHTDADHSGGAVKLLNSLAKEPRLQAHFENTRFWYHRIPNQDPGWTLSILVVSPSSVQSPEYEILCYASEWQRYNERPNDMARNTFFEFTFYVNGVEYQSSSKNSIPVTKDMLNQGQSELRVGCKVEIKQLGTPYSHGKTVEKIPFKMRNTHIDRFSVGVIYKIWRFEWATGPYIGEIRPEITYGTGTTSGETIDPEEQPYRAIDQALEVVRLVGGPGKEFIDRNRVVPIAGKVCYTAPRSRVRIVGPTPIIYRDFIADCLRVEYDTKSKGEKNSQLHNMASIVTLFERFAGNKKSDPPIFTMLYTGDAHDRECQVRDTVASLAGTIPAKNVDVLKIPHHGSISSTSVEFYNRITATVYLVCARQNNHGLPNMEILEAIVDQTVMDVEQEMVGGRQMVHIFFSNPNSLWNIPKPKSGNGQTADPVGKPSNVRLLLMGDKRPGADAEDGKKYNYKCYILKHRVAGTTQWSYDTNSDMKNAGVILLGGKAGKLHVKADEKYWDIWHAGSDWNLLARYNTPRGTSTK